MSWWEASAALNGVIAGCYLVICWTVLRGLRDTGQLRTNALALATAGIFFTCAVHHGSHVVCMILPAFGQDVAAGLGMRRAFGSTMTAWDLVGAVVAIYYLSLRRSYGRLLTTPQMFEDRVREQSREELQLLAYTDSLTGLPNRAAFTAVMDTLSEAGQLPPTLLFLDLDRFKLVNDTLGHECGDRLLAHAAERLRGVLRPDDRLFRLGGDEFTVLVAADEQTALAVADRIRHVLRAPFVLDGREVRVGASIGLAQASTPAEVSDLLRWADTAMYAAKSAGRDITRVFHAGMSDDGDRLALGNDLAQALERSELELAFQPIVDLATREVVGAEALLRWRHPERGLLQPGEFLGVAEEAGHLVAIGRWVVEDACRQTANWPPTATGRALWVSVNVGPTEIEKDDFVSAVGAQLTLSGLSPDRLWIEITEHAVERDTDLLATRLRELESRGVRVALDDFGTGWASLSRLHRLPVDAIKLDGSFVAGAPGSTEAKIAQSVALLAGSLGVPSVAEGIETAEDLARMQALGCQFGQGFFLGRPVSSAALAASLQRTALATLPRPRPAIDGQLGDPRGPLDHLNDRLDDRVR